MNKLIFLVMLTVCSQVLGQELTFHPVGKFTYNQEVKITKKRSAETVSRETVDGNARIKELKKNGYSCIRKDQVKSLCTKIETDLPTPEFIQIAVDNFMGRATFTFPGTGEPTLIFDGANTEWLIQEVVLLGNKKVGMYKITKTFNGAWYVTFPVSEEQGIGTLNLLSNDHLSLPLTLEKKENGQSVGYFITASLKK